MKYEKSVVTSFGAGDAGKHRTSTVHGKDHVVEGQHGGSKMHDSLKNGTPFRTVKSQHEDIHGAKGMETSGALHKSHPVSGAGAFGTRGSHVEMKSDTGKNTYRPTC